MMKRIGLAMLVMCAFARGALAGPGEAWCESTGGHVVVRTPAYGTNNPNPLLLANPQPFCVYTNAADQSKIELAVRTLVTTKPTLAALAYYAKVKPHLKKCVGNPASCYCTQLGGTDLFGGINLGGGGWVTADNPTNVEDACVFPDLSMIDAWGLTYHAVGTIRGIDLAKVLQYPNPN